MPIFDAYCRACPRLFRFLQDVQRQHADYFCAPVPAFGDAQPGLLIVGLAPGMHGANRTGRPFTGDYAGVLLYQTLYELGLASMPESTAADDELQLFGVRITNAVKCLPPQNKPNRDEIMQCNAFLHEEISNLPADCKLLALGKIAHDAILRSEGLRLSRYPFAHGACHRLPGGRELYDSYHCSRYNTQTKRLTARMFHDVLRQASRHIAP